MSNVLVDKYKIDILANAIANKSGEAVTMTLSGMVQAVDGIETGGGEPNLQSKTYTVDSAGTETITADSGYDGLSEVEVTVPQGEIYVENYKGFYTASGARKWHCQAHAVIETGDSYGTSGFIADHTSVRGTDNVYNAIPTGTTVTPTTSSQTIGGADTMMESAVTVNPIPSNYKDTTDATATADKILQGYTAYANGQKLVGTASGGITPSGTYSITSNGIYDIVSFASVDVNVSGGGGGDHDAEDGIVDRTISGVYENSRVTQIGSYAFYSCTRLTTANFPNATSIGSYAFQSCTSLTTVSFPNATSVGSYAFYNCTRLTTANFPNVTSIGSFAFSSCTSLTTVSFPNATSIGTYAFYSCKSLTTANFPNATSIGANAFSGCTRLTTASFPKATSIGANCFRNCQSLESLYLLASSVATLGNSVFLSTPMSLSSYLGHFGSIYVPASLVDTYKSKANWSAYSARITAYTE